MKFTKQTKLAIAIVLIYLTTFAELTQLESTKRLNLKSQLQSNSNSKAKTNSSKTKTNSNSSDYVLTDHPLANFLIGTLEGLGGNETGFYQCLPDAWKKKGNVADTEVKGLNSSFNDWSPGLSTFLSASEPVIKFACSTRDHIMKMISGLVSLGLKKQLKRKFREASFMQFSEKNKRTEKTKRKMHSKRFAAAAYMRNYRAVMLISEAKVQWFWDDIKNNIFKQWFQPIQNKVTSLVQSISNFFKNPIFAQIRKAYDCVQTLKNAAKTIVDTLKELKNKFDVLMQAASNQVLLIITVVDYLLAMICNWQKFKQAVEFLIGGLSNKDDKMKWLLFGKALGTLFFAVSTSKTYGTDQYKNVQSQISRKR
jgi:hypothetical protein